MKLVYISSPFTQGDTLLNVRCSIDAFNTLLDSGECVPISPLSMTSMAHVVQPRSYDAWMDYDLALLSRCDAVLVIDAVYGDYVQSESKGVAIEEAFASERNIPTFYSLEQLEAWLTDGTY